MHSRGPRALTAPRLSDARDGAPDLDDDEPLLIVAPPPLSSRTTPGPGNVTPSVRLGGTGPSQPSLVPLADLAAVSAVTAVPGGDPSGASPESPQPAPADAPEPIGYLLVIEGTASSIFPLPGYGEVTIGRAAEAHLRLVSPLVSRLHARLFIGDGEARVLDLGSHNGTRVNGALIGSAQTLASGDVIAISDVLLCFHRQVPRILQRPIYPDLTILRHRLEEEVDRCLRAGRRLRGGRRSLERRARTESFRGLALVCVHLPGFGEPARPLLTRALGQKVRLMDVLAFDGPDQMQLLLPDVDDDEALRLARRLLRLINAVVPGSRAGLATCPTDGCDGDTLLAAARGARDAAEPNQVLAAAETITPLQIADRTIYYAEPAMLRLHELCARLGRSDQPVLILGEEGSGRETIALSIATFRDRARRRETGFLRLDCRQGARPAAVTLDSAQRSGAPFLDSAQRSGAPFLDSAQRSGAPFLDSAQRSGAPFIDPSTAASLSELSISSLSNPSIESLERLLLLDSDESLPSRSSASLLALGREQRIPAGGADPRAVEVLLFGLAPCAEAPSGRAGLFEGAGEGSVYLAEVAALPADAQARLAHLLTTGHVTRVGGARDVRVSCRVLCSSSRDLHAEVRAGRFRADLLERLRGTLTGPPAGAVVVLPPLRERRRELPILIRALLREACARLRREDRDPPQLSPAALERLLFYPWPGNLRELCETVAFLASGTARLIEPEHLPPNLVDLDG